MFRAGFAASSFLFLLSCSKLDKDSNCLNDKAACFKADKTPPQLAVNGAVSPTQGQVVSVLGSVDLMFTEELNNPQPADFVFSGAASMTVNAVQKLNDYTYRLILTQNSLTSGTIFLNFSNLKDYNGNKITGSTTVSYVGNVDIPITVPLVDANNAPITNPSHYGLSGTAGGYDTIDVFWYYSYVPPAANPGTTVYSVKWTTGSTDCKDPSATAISSWNVAPTPALGTVATYNSTDATTRAATTNKITLKTTEVAPPGTYNRTILICVDNDTNNKHGAGVINIIRDDSAPTVPANVTLSPPAGNYPLAQTLTFSCADNSDRIIYTVASNVGQPADPAAPADPGFTAGVIDIGSTLYDPANKPATPYSGNTTRAIYKYRCIDKAGNVSGVVTSGAYRVNDSYPTVTFTSLVKTGTSVEIAGLSTGGYTSATINWSSNQISQAWQLRTDALDCSAVAGTTIVTSGTTPAAVNQNVPIVITPGSTNITALGNYVLRICVTNGTDWAQTSFNLLRDDGPLAAPTANISGGNYGAEQNLVFSCSVNTDKIAYTMASQAGATAPPLTVNPDFTANGLLDTSITGNTLFATPLKTQDGNSSVYKAICIDKAGNKSGVLSTAAYTIDSILPTITIVSNSRDVLSNVAGYTATTLTWRSSRGNLPYDIRKGSTNCSEGGPQVLSSPTLQSGTTPADINQTITSTFDVANFGGEGTTNILICVKNLINRWGYTGKDIVRDTVPPVMPGNLVVSVSAADTLNFNFNWTAATDVTSGIAGYRIYRTLNSNSYLNYPTTWDYTATSGPAILAMPDLQRYFLRIVPVDAGGNVPTGTPLYYTEVSTKPSITLTVNSALTGSTFTLSDGVATAPVTAGVGTTTVPWTTSVGAGSTYNFSISNPPAGKVCAIHEMQFGTLTADLMINITCVNGYTVGQNVNTVPATKLGYRLFQGKNTAIAGSGSTTPFANGVSAAASFNFPEYVAHAAGFLYVSDTNNHVIRKIDLTTNTVSVAAGVAPSPAPNPGYADGACLSARFNQPMGIFADGTNLYVADYNNHVIRKISDVNGAGCTVTTLAGTSGLGYVDGAANIAKFNFPRQIAGNKDYLFVADNANHLIRRISLASGNVETVIGNTSTTIDTAGTGAAARIVNPVGLALIGNTLYASSAQNRILSIDVSGTASYGVTTIVAGDGTSGYIDAAGTTARFDGIYAMTTDGVDLYFVEVNNHLIRRVEISQNFKVTTLAGAQGVPNDVTGVTGVSARFNVPHGIATDGRNLFIANHTAHTIRKLTDNGLVGYWPIDPGVNPNDYSSENNGVLTGTLTGGPLSTDVDRFGTNNRASTFAGSQYIATTATTGLPGGNAPRTLCAWVKPNGSQTQHAGIVSYGYTGAAGSAFGLTMEPNNGFKIWEHSVGDIPVNAVLPAGTWSHVCAMHNNLTGITAAYLNGHLVATAPQPAILTGTTVLHIGRNIAGPYDFNGAIADVRLYQRVLSEGEINELAQDAGGTAQVGNSFNTGATGLLSHYEFSGGVPALANLQASGPLGGTLGNSASSPLGKDGDASGSAYFNGTANLTGAATGLPAGNAPRTMCAYFAPQSYPSGTYAYAVSYGDVAGFSGFGIGIKDIGGGVYQITNTFSSGGDNLVTFRPPLNSWNHLCASYDGTTSMLYLNGAFMGSQPAALTTVLTSFNIGSWVNNSQYMQGKIDDVRIYNNALSAVQIRQLATQVPSGLLRRFDLNDAVAGGKAVDVAGWGENASIAGATQSADRFQQANQSYNFNGSAQSISGDDIGLPTNTSPRTLCSWIRPTAYPSTFGVIVKYGVGGPSRMDALALQGSTSIAHAGFSADHIVAYKVPLNTWTHLCGTFYSNAGTPTSQIFVNGASLGIDTTPGTIGSWGTTLSGGSTLNIGLPDYDANQRFIGDIDDVRIYNRVVSAAEIRALAGYHPMQVSSWSPNVATSSLKFFLQPESATYAAGGCAGGANCVSAWNDTSGNNFNVAQATGNAQPVFDSVGINGKPGVKFLGAGTTLTPTFMTGTCNLALNSAASTFFTVFKEGTQSGNNGIFQSGTFAPGGGKLIYFINNPLRGPSLFDLGTGGAGVLNLWDSDGGLKYNNSGETVLMSMNFSGTGGNMYKNGTAVVTSQAISSGYSCGPGQLHLGRYYFGGTYPGDGGYFDGYIGDFIFFNQVLTTASVYGASYTDREVVQCYLSAKYAQPLAAGVTCP